MLKCKICLKTGLFARHVFREMMFGTREEFLYFECDGCGCVQIESVPSDMAAHYPSNYYSQQGRAVVAEGGRFKRMITRWYGTSAVVHPDSWLRAFGMRMMHAPQDFSEYGQYLVSSHLKSRDSRILDVGCGAVPHRLNAFSRFGFSRVEGVDPYIQADLIYLGVPVHKKTIDQVEGIFSLVMFHHSLEHMTDPVDALRQAARLLEDGGTCLIRVPVFGTELWRRYGKNWVELDAPRHLFLMSRGTIDFMAGAAGFEVVKTVFDSAGWELARSEQYRRDLPLVRAGSVEQLNMNELFGAGELDSFESEAKRLNAAMDGGRACFYLRKKSSKQINYFPSDRPLANVQLA